LQGHFRRYGSSFLYSSPLKSLHDHDARQAEDFGEPMSAADHLKMVRLPCEFVDHEEEAFFEIRPGNQPRDELLGRGQRRLLARRRAATFILCLVFE
jgi:hypothetical protein